MLACEDGSTRRLVRPRCVVCLLASRRNDGQNWSKYIAPVAL